MTLEEMKEKFPELEWETGGLGPNKKESLVGRYPGTNLLRAAIFPWRSEETRGCLYGTVNPLDYKVMSIESLRRRLKLESFE